MEYKGTKCSEAAESNLSLLESSEGGAMFKCRASEPDVPALSFRPLARSKQALSQQEALEVLKRSKRGILSLLGENGYPYGVPINHWYCPEDGRLYFHSGKNGHKIDAMRENIKASFCVMEQGLPADGDWALPFKSVIVFGRLEFVADHAKALAISRQISYQFTDDEAYIDREIQQFGDAVLCFSLIPEYISGKRVTEK